MIVESLPPLIANNLAVISLLLAGIVVEKQYIGRIGVFSNSIALNSHLIGTSVGLFSGIYADLALIFGILGLTSYVTDTSLGRWYYLPAFAFSSIPIGIVIFFLS